MKRVPEYVEPDLGDEVIMLCMSICGVVLGAAIHVVGYFVEGFGGPLAFTTGALLVLLSLWRFRKAWKNIFE